MLLLLFARACNFSLAPARPVPATVVIVSAGGASRTACAPLAVHELEACEAGLSALSPTDAVPALSGLSDDLVAAWKQVVVVRNALRDKRKDFESSGAGEGKARAALGLTGYRHPHTLIPSPQHPHYPHYPTTPTPAPPHPLTSMPPHPAIHATQPRTPMPPHPPHTPQSTPHTPHPTPHTPLPASPEA